MDSTALSYHTKPPRVKWSPDMRVFLCCMLKYFNKDNGLFEAVFNARFGNELRACGFGPGRTVEWRRLNIQWVDMRRRGDSIWGDVHLSDFNPQPWLEVLWAIEQTAADLNLNLVKKSGDTIEKSLARFAYRSPTSTQTPLSQHTTFQKTPVSSQSDSPTTPFQELPQSTESAAESSLCTAGGKTCLWCYMEGLDKGATDSLKQHELPPLLYRWWNVDSQGVNSKAMFVAGWFSDTSNKYYTPDILTDDEFCRKFESHIRIEPTASPFISTFKSALAPVHRGLRSQEGASISIIDTTKLKSNIYSAMAFVRDHKVKIGTYSGAGEYLVWGQVNSDAIIGTFKVTALERLASEHPDIDKLLQLDRIATSKRNRRALHQAMARNAVHPDKRAGSTVGKLLLFLNIPQEYCKEVSRGIVYSWRINRRNMPWHDFFEGVDLGYRGNVALPSLGPLIPELSPAPELSPLPDITADHHNISDWEYDISSDDEEDKTMEEFEDEGTPTPVARPGTAMGNPFRTLASSMTTLGAHSDIGIAIVVSSDEEMGDIDQEHERSEETIPEHEEIANDKFASDRARVQYILGNTKFNSSG
ncbi:hypothetical protein BDV18DRAFT_161864 [Aspergillus unguis]